MKVLLFVIFITLVSPLSKLRAQCCAMGTPFNNTAVAGISEKGYLQASLTYKYGLFSTYYRNRVRLINYGMYDQLSYQFLALNLSYGITSRLSLEHETGYFLSKALVFADPELNQFANEGQGFSNGQFILRYAFLVLPAKRLTIDAGAGFRYPYTRQSQSVNGVELPIEAQPSNGAFGGLAQMRISKQIHKFNTGLQYRYDFNAPNYDDYTFGDSHIVTLSFASEINRTFTGIMLVRNEYRNSDTAPNNAILASEGSNLLILAPQLNMRFFKDFQFSVFGDIPVYRYYFGEQISMRYALGVSLIWNGSLNKKTPGATGFEMIEGY